MSLKSNPLVKTGTDGRAPRVIMRKKIPKEMKRRKINRLKLPSDGKEVKKDLQNQIK